ncbi:Gfo/Idh/MocA family oxidoreductase [Marinilongibacter aquaticus]|uniref:putative oxidoreductase C-terminal domain-containing protein n=1 Tax=Marinilongibacter aquaticus TaxID=2975157 RepID=UPI0021BD7139|nr:putative oxidoreductase C-terminal domain-containing protein [Marinilongibacter aquaticus]UBM57484.1 Gfo/Idh/MocA family oxidoreductase [Marinilongibacter aquaticus]
MNLKLKLLGAAALTSLAACQSPKEENKMDKIELITLDPGHFHAALVQKSMYPEVDSLVHVYAPEGPDVDLHLDRIKAFNERAENPTHWEEVVYRGGDFFEKMLEEKAGNVVMLAGNNQKKTEYIEQSIANGFNVYADKPMAINKADFELLKKAFAEAEEKGLLLYDIMTERYEITTTLQKALSQTSLFGDLEKGTVESPAVTKESVHHFFKYVSGKPLIRPSWFFDVEQEGDGIVDVTTHLVDLVMWECFPEQIIDTTNIQMLNAKRWPTVLSPADFNKVTGQDKYPAYLSQYLNGDNLEVFSNGEMNYTVNGVHAKVSVIWNFEAPEGAGDTHYSIMRGTKANLIIKQGEEQNYKPTLYVELLDGQSEESIKAIFEELNKSYEGVTYTQNGQLLTVQIPDHYKEGHEAHFARVTEHYLKFLKEKNIPKWEIPNMIAKYYTTTEAYKMALK